MAFPSPPPTTPGATHTQGGALWEWDGTKWIARGSGAVVTASYVPVAAITSGNQTLGGADVQAALQALFQRLV